MEDPRKETAAAPDQSGGSVSKLDTARAKSSKNAQNAPTVQDAQEVDPELIPANPAFNVKRYREMLSSLDLAGLEHRLNKAVEMANNSANTAAQYTEAEITGGIVSRAVMETTVSSLQEIIEIAKWAKDTAQEMLSPELRRLFDLRDTLENVNWKAFIAALQEGEKRIAALEPFLEAELPTIRKQPGYEAFTLEDLESYIELDGQTIADDRGGEPIPAIIRAAIERAAAAAYKADFTITAAKRAEIVDIPLDKVNSTIWGLIRETTGRQEKLSLKAERDGDEKPLNIYYSIDFDDLETAGVKITKRLTLFDKRVYQAIAALFNAGNTVISLTQIHYAMGNTSRPSDDQREKIDSSITKMRFANVFLDNMEESQRYNYPRFKAGTGIYCEFYLLPVDRISAIINGQVVESAIQVLKEPPLMTFARQRKQITTITVKVLQSPLSKTEANLQIDDYLIERIAKAKRTSKGVKILYETLYKAAQIKTKNQRTRAPEKIAKYLDHYKACGFISSYTMLKDGIQILF